MRQVVAKIAEQVSDSTKIAILANSIMKASLNFPTKLWWVVLRSWIQPTLAINTFTLDHVNIVANILAGQEIYWANLIAEHTHEAAMKSSNSIPFPFLIYRLYRVEVVCLHDLDLLVEVQHTLDANLIKVEDNLVSLQLASRQLAQMPEMFAIEPPSEAPSTTIATTTTKERTPQLETHMEKGPTTNTSALQVSPTSAAPARMVYVTAVSIQSIAQRLTKIKSQLIQSLQHIWPQVCQAITESKGYIQVVIVTTILDRPIVMYGHIDAFELRVQQSLITTGLINIITLQIEIQQL